MRIIRYEDAVGRVRYGVRLPDGTAQRIVGDIFGAFEASPEPADVARLLAPVAPVNILGIGRNYRLHAAEGGSPPPERPIVFMKATTIPTWPIFTRRRATGPVRCATWRRR